MKIVEVNHAVLDVIAKNPSTQYKVTSVGSGGQVLIRAGNITYRLRLSSVTGLKKNDTITIDPTTQEISVAA